MSKKVVMRTASDNLYFHKDFHGALNQALIYVEEHFGEEAVREYLEQFAKAFYAPLTRALTEKGLGALKAYLEHIYTLEGADVRIELAPDDGAPDVLTLFVEACPAVAHIKKMGLPLSRHFVETTRTVNETICAGTPFQFELVAYEPASGKSTQRFSRRPEAER
jgi:hypothetical protein